MTRRLTVGGAERQLVVLARELHRRGNHDVIAATFYGGGALESELTESGVPFQPLGKRGRYDNVRFFFSLLSFLRSRRVDVVFSYLPGDNIAAAIVKLFRPGLRIVWGIHSARRNPAHHDRFSRTVYWLEALLSRIPDRVIAVSEVGRFEARLRGFQSEEIMVIPNAVDVDRFVPARHLGAELRREWNLAPDEPLIGIVGRIQPVKDHRLFLRAASEFRRRVPRARFAVIGDGPLSYIDELKSFATQLDLDDVLWLGTRSDLPAIYNALNLLSVTSESEAGPNVIIEAMSCGVPCVSADVGAAAEMIGDTGIVVSSRTPEAFADAWARLLDSDRESLGRRARERIVSRYSISRTTSDIERALTEW